MRKYIYITALLLLMIGTGACTKQSVTGNMIGVIIREGTTEVVPNPVLIINQDVSGNLVPNQTVHGDSGGRYSTNVPEGNYRIKIGLKNDGPFYTWPDPVVVQGNRTSIYNFTLPVDFK